MGGLEHHGGGWRLNLSWATKLGVNRTNGREADVRKWNSDCRVVSQLDQWLVSLTLNEQTGLVAHISLTAPLLKKHKGLATAFVVTARHF